MPFEGPDDPKLPNRIQEMSLQKRRQWVGAWNGSFEDCQSEGGADCEGRAFRIANAAIKQGGNDMGEELSGVDVKFGFNEPDFFDFIERQIPQQVANYNPLGGSADRACANCQWFIAPNSCATVEGAPEPIVPTGLSDEWRARVPQQDMRSPLPVMIVNSDSDSGEASLKQTKRESGQDFPPEDFAVVPEVDSPTTWKLRLTESPGKFTVAQIGRAITAMQPSGFRGNQVELTGDQKSQAVSRIGGAIRRVDGTSEQKSNLRERLDDVKAVEVVIHGSPSMSSRLKDAIMEMTRKAFSRDSGKDDDAFFDSQTFFESGSSFKLMKDANDAWRWVSIVTNKFRDRDNPPEIFMDKAHKEYIEYLDRTSDFPELWLWHTPGTKFGKADWATYDNGFVIMSGVVDPDMSYAAENLSAMGNLGVSHGFHYTYADKSKGLIGWYRTFEISPLQADKAANPWATIGFLQKETSTMETQKRAWLVNALGEEKVSAIEQGTQTLEKTLDEAGIEWKSLSVAEGSDKDTDEKEGPEDDEPEDIAAVASAKAVASAILESEQFMNLLNSVKGIDERVKALEASDDEKIAAKIVSRASGMKTGHIASQSEGNTLSKEEADKLPGPSTDWFTEVTEQVFNGQTTS